jgi:hypothetical protein
VQDNSTGCAHSNYNTLAAVTTPDDRSAEYTQGGEATNVSIATNGVNGNYTLNGNGTFFCSCVAGNVGFGGVITISLGVSVNIFQYSTIAAGVGCVYYPIPSCSTKCLSPQITGPLPCYEYVVENYPWFQYTSGPTGYFRVTGGRLAAPTNNDLSDKTCFDTTLFPVPKSP